ncbi:hypothetical protein [Escherichia coli]|uniref:hypothetical protein n=1 Tax=Escherichia coli TaxID=562 RepID=UPI0032EB4ECD
MYGVAQGTLFCGESMFSRMEMRPKRRFWSSVMNLSVMAVNLSTARSLTITQHRLVPAKFPAGITLIISIKCASDDCRIISGYLDACFHHKNECFGTFSPECYNCGRRVGYAHYPAADKEFFASGNAHRLSHRSLIRCAFGAA